MPISGCHDLPLAIFNLPSRNNPQSKRQQRPPTKPKTPRAVTLWRHACLTTPVVKPSPLQPPSVQTATAPKTDSSPKFPKQQKICHNPPMLFVILEIALALAIVGLIVFWIARPPK